MARIRNLKLHTLVCTRKLNVAEICTCAKYGRKFVTKLYIHYTVVLDTLII
jgi:hypothetical protein